MKLYVVEIERTMLVLAENEQEAEETAESCEQEEMHNFSATFRVMTAERRNVPPQWLNAIPYGGSSDDTVRQIMAAECMRVNGQ